MAATVCARSQGSITIDKKEKRCILLPLSYYFDLHMSYASLIDWGAADTQSSDGVETVGYENKNNTKHVVVFFPLAAGSYDRHEAVDSAKDAALSSLQEVCSAAGVCGIFTSVSAVVVFYAWC